MAEFIGSKISLISRSDIRYVGILHEINVDESTVALEQVRSFGTEGRRGGDEVPPSDNIFEYIVFRGSDVKDLKVEEAAKKPEAPPPPAVPDDPAILATGAPAPRTQQSLGYPPMPGYPPPLLGYGNFQYPPPPFGGPSGFRPPPSQHMAPPAGFVYPNYPQGMPPAGFGGPASAGGPQAPQRQQPQPAPTPPPPVKETKPDVATATVPPPVPPTLKPAPIQPNAAKQNVAPAVPIQIPISIPVQTRPTKPSPATSPQPPVAETAKVATTADVQSLTKNLSEIKLLSTPTQPSDNTPGAGGYLTNPHVGYRRRYYPQPVSLNAPNMNQEYDFESANAKFNKWDIAKEVAAAQTSTTTTTDGTTAAESAEPSTGPSSASLVAALAGGDGGSFYDKGKSFFDNISCENKERAAASSGSGEAPATYWKRNDERRLNIETFGQASIDYGGGRYGSRGGYRGGRGGMGYRGGRGYGGGGYRGGGYRGNTQWRGGPPRTTNTNGPNSYASGPTTNSTNA